MPIFRPLASLVWEDTEMTGGRTWDVKQCVREGLIGNLENSASNWPIWLSLFTFEVLVALSLEMEHEAEGRSTLKSEVAEMTFSIKKRIIIELFIDREHGLYMQKVAFKKLSGQFKEGKLKMAGNMCGNENTNSILFGLNY